MIARLVVIALLAGCKRAPSPARPAGARPSIPEVAADGFPAWHVGGRLCFADEAGEWRFDRSTSYAETPGTDVSFHYRRPQAVATLYVYPSRFEPDGDRSKEQVELIEVAHVVPDVTWVGDGDFENPHWAGTGRVVVGHQELMVAADGSVARKVHTLAAVHGHGAWTVKLRLTWDPERDELGKLLEELLDNTGVPCAPPKRPSPAERYRP